MITKYIIFAIFGCLLVQGAVTPQGTKMRNIDYLAKGYNIYYGNPFPIGDHFDRGFTLQIFDFTYDEQKPTSDGRFLIPKGVDFFSQDSCQFDVQADEIISEKSYYEKLSSYVSQEVSASFGSIGASFGFSKESMSMKQEKTSEKYVHIMSTSECAVYRGKMIPSTLPDLARSFKSAIEELPETYDQNEYFEFLENYGTHYLKEVSMGSRMTYIYSFTEKDRAEMNSRSVDIKASASISLFGVKSTTSTGNHKESSQTEDLQKKAQSTKVSSVGSKPSANAMDWTKQVVNEPMPIKYSLTPIYKLVNHAKKSFSSEKGAKIEQVFKNIESAMKNYCNDYLKKIYPNQSCDGPQSEQKPQITTECALCAQQCGDKYSVDSGTLAYNQNGNYDKSFNTLGPRCFGKLDRNSLGNEGAKLCCMPQNLEKEESGACKLCESCPKKGKFSYMSGKVAAGLGIHHWVKAAGPHCNENILSKQASKDGFDLCCSRPDACTLCKSCAGLFPHDLGVIGILENNPNQFSARGQGCLGAVDKLYGYQNGVRLCCSGKSLESGINMPNNNLHDPLAAMMSVFERAKARRK